AFAEGRLRHLSNGDVEWFMGFLAKGYDRQCEEALRKWAASSWDAAPLSDDRWHAYVQWLRWRASPQVMASAYREFLEPLHRHFDEARKTPALAEVYTEFAVTFYRVN